MKFRNLLLLLFLGLILFLPSPSTTQTRDSDKVYKVAILPFLIHSQESLDYLRDGIYDILSSRITVEGRIAVVERSMVERALYEERPMRLDETTAKKIGMRVGADYIVLGSLTKIGDYISLDARLISITEEKPPLSAYTQHKGIDDVMVKIGDFAQDIGYQIVGRRARVGRSTEPRHPFIVKQRREIGRTDPGGLDFKRSQDFNFEIKGLDIGDVDGDKKNEVVVMDGHNLYIFKYDGNNLQLFQKIEMGFHYNFLTLDVADVNRNGYAEIIVTSVVEDNLQSFILEFEEGKFKIITNKSGWYFRVLDHPKEGPILMGQRMGSRAAFDGPIYQFIWKKRSFEQGPIMRVPKEARKEAKIFGFTVADIRKEGIVDTIKLDDADRLKIISPDGKSLWMSSERYGGSMTSYDTTKVDKDGFVPWSRRVYIPPRIIVKDLDGDGVPEIIIHKNQSSTTYTERIRNFEKGEIYSLIWDEDALMTNWKTREINGYIADYQVKDAENDGEEELVVAVALPPEKTGIFSEKSKSYILFFKLF